MQVVWTRRNWDQLKIAFPYASVLADFTNEFRLNSLQGPFETAVYESRAEAARSAAI